MTDKTSLEKLDTVWKLAMMSDAKLWMWHMDHTTYRDLIKQDRKYASNFSYGEESMKLRGIPITFHVGPLDYNEMRDIITIPTEIVHEPFMLSLEVKNRVDRSFYIDHPDCHNEWKRDPRP